jgi:hypothetical protein
LCSSTSFLSSNNAISTPDEVEFIINSLFKMQLLKNSHKFPHSSGTNPHHQNVPTMGYPATF